MENPLCFPVSNEVSATRNTCQIISRILPKFYLLILLTAAGPRSLLLPLQLIAHTSTLSPSQSQSQSLSPSLVGVKLVSHHTREASVILDILSSLHRDLRGHWGEQIPPPRTHKVFASMKPAKTTNPCPPCHAETWPLHANSEQSGFPMQIPKS